MDSELLDLAQTLQNPVPVFDTIPECGKRNSSLHSLISFKERFLFEAVFCIILDLEEFQWWNAGITIPQMRYPNLNRLASS